MKIVENQIPELIRQQKDKMVIDHLYKELFPTVQRHIKKNNGIVEDAYDVFQDAIVYFYKLVSTNKYDDEKYTVYGFIYRLAINRWINKLNKDKKMVFKTEIGEEFTKDETIIDIEDSIEVHRSEKNIIRKFVNYIGERCVELLTYRVYSNMMFEDIMYRMEFNSESATKMYFKRCREKMVTVLKENPALAAQLKGHG